MEGKFLEDYISRLSYNEYKKGEIIEIIEVEYFKNDYKTYYNSELCKKLDLIPKKIIKLI